MHISAPAKINLHLRVGPPVANGFHPLVSWMCTVGLFDTLTLTPSDQTQLRCSDASIPCDGGNLVNQAMELLHQELGHLGIEGAALPHIAIDLEKQIPQGGGLGGGSSDAAATLIALNDLWKLNLSDSRLSELAARLGSDVPFFLFGPSSVCRGRGEIVQPIARPKPAAAVLILPDIALPTPAVYRAFDELRLGNDAGWSQTPEWQQWADLSAGLLLAGLVNDLEPAAFHLRPKLGTLRSEIEQTIGQPVRMSGSGSSLFTITDEHAAAEQVAAHISRAHRIRARSVTLAPAADPR